MISSIVYLGYTWPAVSNRVLPNHFNTAGHMQKNQSYKLRHTHGIHRMLYHVYHVYVVIYKESLGIFMGPYITGLRYWYTVRFFNQSARVRRIL